MDAESEKVKDYVDKVYNETPEKIAECEADIRKKMELCKGQEERIAKLPMEDTIWFIKEMETETHEDGSTHRYLSMVDRAGVGIGVTNADISKVELKQHSYDLVCFCTLFPIVRQARRPRMVTFMEKSLTKDNALDLSKLGIKFISPGLNETALSNIDVPWMRECTMCQLRGTTDLFKTCSSCQAVIYCSRECQKKHWSQKGELKSQSHKQWCTKLKQYMSKTEELAKFPFTFTSETTPFEFNIFQCQKFLEDRGIYNQGLWRRECPTWHVPGQFIQYGEIPECNDPIVLPVESSILDSPPTNKAPDLSQPITDWEAYYLWRGFRLDSPIAMLLNYPLTLYYIITTCLPRDYPTLKLCSEKKYVIDVVGVEKEVEMISVFKEVRNLLPDIQLVINLVGTEISKTVDGKEWKGDNLTIKIHHNLYHKYSGPRPHLVIGFNAGLAAYIDWAATMKKLKVNNIPGYFTDYCQYSCHCAQIAMEGSTLGSIIPLEINPFRSPFRKVCEENNMPWYSNAFLFRLLYGESEDS